MPPLETPPALRASTRQPRKRSPQSPAPRGPDQPASPDPVGAGAAAAAGTAGGAVGVAAAAVPALTLSAAGGVTVAAALQVFDEFLERVRFRNEVWLRREGARREGAQQSDVLTVIADENERQVEFERRVRERVTRDLAQIAALPRAEQREPLRKVLEREKRYARQRAEAMAVRAIAAVDREVLRRESPNGAFWRLGPTMNHTPDCVAMSGRFWPWEVLTSFHPPTHPGCLCSLHSYAKAVSLGWMRSGDVMDVGDALRRAAAAKALLNEEDFAGILDALERTGLVAADGVDSLIWGLIKEGS